MVRVLIPSYSQIKPVNGQAFTVYNVEVFHNGVCTKLQPRYSDFHHLHTKLKKFGRRSHVEFPPKKVRNLSSKVIELRRAALEAYLQSVVGGDRLPKVLVAFLSLPEDLCYPFEPNSNVCSSSFSAMCDGLETDEDEADEQTGTRMSHQPVVGFTSQLARFPFMATETQGMTESASANQHTGSHHTSSSNIGPTVVTTTVTSPNGTHSRHSSSSSLVDVVLKGALDAIYTASEEDFHYAGV